MGGVSGQEVALASLVLEGGGRDFLSSSTPKLACTVHPDRGFRKFLGGCIGFAWTSQKAPVVVPVGVLNLDKGPLQAMACQHVDLNPTCTHC